jgi:hypothetical protein
MESVAGLLEQNLGVAHPVSFFFRVPFLCSITLQGSDGAMRQPQDDAHTTLDQLRYSKVLLGSTGEGISGKQSVAQ